MKQKNLTEDCPNKCTHFCEDGYKRGYDEAWESVGKWHITLFLIGLFLGGGVMFLILK